LILVLITVSRCLFRVGLLLFLLAFLLLAFLVTSVPIWASLALVKLLRWQKRADVLLHPSPSTCCLQAFLGNRLSRSLWLGAGSAPDLPPMQVQHFTLLPIVDGTLHSSQFVSIAMEKFYESTQRAIYG